MGGNAQGDHDPLTQPLFLTGNRGLVSSPQRSGSDVAPCGHTPNAGTDSEQCPGERLIASVRVGQALPRGRDIELVELLSSTRRSTRRSPRRRASGQRSRLHPCVGLAILGMWRARCSFSPRTWLRSSPARRWRSTEEPGSRNRMTRGLGPGRPVGKAADEGGWLLAAEGPGALTTRTRSFSLSLSRSS